MSDSPEELSRLSWALSRVEGLRERRSFVDSLIEARDRLDNGDLDVVVVAARRMTCLYSLFLSAGLRSPRRGEVTSDRFLTIRNLDEWRGKRVLLLDDTKITGCTIESRAAVLRACAPEAEIDEKVVLDLSVDPPRDSRDIAEIRQHLHLEFAAIFGEKLIPYFTDFPTSTECKLAPSDFSKLLEMPGWTCVDVTNRALARSRCRSFTLLPPDGLIESYCQSLGIPCSWLKVAKLRVISRDDGAGTVFRVVPIVLTGPFPNDRLLALAAKCSLRTEGDGVAAEMMGLVSYLLSVQFLKYMRGEIEVVTGVEVNADASIEQLVMGAELRALLPSILDGLESWLSTVDLSDFDAEVEGDSGLQLGDQRVTEFASYLILGDNLVRPAFKLFFSGESNGEQRTYIPIDVGSRQAKENVGSYSLALDVLNDLGFAVPEFKSLDGVSCRVFRNGEPNAWPTVGPLGGRLALLAETMEVVRSGAGSTMRPLFRT